MAFKSELDDRLVEFIAAQQMFFVATAPDRGGRVNLSPKGMDTFRVLSHRQVAYLDLTGSGNETAAHLTENGRLVIMLCSFGEEPLILRLYGRGRPVRRRDAEWAELITHYNELPGTRQIMLLDIESVQTSCGFAVPVYEFVRQRGEKLCDWAVSKGPAGIAEYWQTKNQTSIDGLPTGLLDISGQKTQ